MRPPGLILAAVHRCAVPAFALALLAASPAVMLPPPVCAEVLPEYQVKAAFFFNFLRFTGWPEASNGDPGAPVIIGIVGDDPFQTFLEETVKDKKIGGRPVVIRRSLRVEDLLESRAIFISRSESGRLPEILAALNGKPALSVSDIRGFAANGGMIAMFVDQGKVRFEINLSAVKRNGLSLSSQLLKLAAITGGEER